jgi:hypothetical protein
MGLIVHAMAMVQAKGQVAPSAFGPRHFSLSGEFTGSLRFTQAYTDWNPQGQQGKSIFSGDLNYINGNQARPFALKMAGGYSLVDGGIENRRGPFERLTISHSIRGQKWSLDLDETESFLQQAPIVGFSGTPGTGEPIGGPGGPPTGQTIFAIDITSLENIASANLGVRFENGYNVSVGGEYRLMRYPNNNGIDTDDNLANFTLGKRLDARTSISLEYAYGIYSYPDSHYRLNTHAIMAGHQRIWTRHWRSAISAGPQMVDSSNSLLVPHSVGLVVGSSIQAKYRVMAYDLLYQRQVSDGAGHLFGSRMDSVFFSARRDRSRTSSVGVEAGYRRMQEIQLGATGVVESGWGGLMSSKRIHRNVDFTGTFTATYQTSPASVFGTALNSMYIVASAGFTYNLRPAHPGE